MTSKQGTGDKLGEIDCGRLGTIEVYDDGDPDPYVNLKNGGGDFAGIGDLVYMARDNGMDDKEIMEIISNIDFREGSGSNDSGGVQHEDNRTRFVCVDCYKTWPNKNNTGGDVCPECDPGTNWEGF